MGVNAEHPFGWVADVARFFRKRWFWLLYVGTAVIVVLFVRRTHPDQLVLRLSGFALFLFAGIALDRVAQRAADDGLPLLARVLRALSGMATAMLGEMTSAFDAFPIGLFVALVVAAGFGAFRPVTPKRAAVSVA